jgi:hypothetical protein
VGSQTSVPTGCHIYRHKTSVRHHYRLKKPVAKGAITTGCNLGSEARTLATDWL